MVKYVIAALGAAFVVGLGTMLAKRAAQQPAAAAAREDAKA